MPSPQTDPEWTPGILKQYMEMKIAGLEKAIETAHWEMNRRLESMNEMRSQLNDQAGKFLSKEVYDTRHELLSQRMSVVEKNQAVAEGKASQTSVLISYAFTLLSILVGAVGIVLALRRG